ncbi:MAG: helix-turn-helix domain-containing protein [Thermomicrobiales bacterium]
MSIETSIARVVASLDWDTTAVSFEPELGAPAERLRSRLGDGVLRWMLGAVGEVMTALGQRISDALVSRTKIRVLSQHILIDILLELAGDDVGTGDHRRIDPDLAADFVARDVATAEIVGSLRLMQRSWLVRLVDAAAVVDRDPTRLMPDLAASVTSNVDAWVEVMIEALVKERRRVARSDERRVRSAIEALIAGTPLVPEVATTTVRRQLTWWHRCCVIGVKSGEAVDRQAVEDAGKVMARHAGGAPFLRYETANGTTYLWTTSEQVPKELDVATLGIVPPLVAGIGEPHRGQDGFRRSFIEADDALRLALRKEPSGGLSYRDEALAIILSRDDERARWFVEQELGDLVGNQPEHAEMRKTLRVFFATRMRIAPAAERLFIHRNTLIQRLERIENIIGHPLSERTAEVQAALSIAELYPSDVAPRQPEPDVPRDLGDARLDHVLT